MIVSAQLEQHEQFRARQQRILGNIVIRPRQPPVVARYQRRGCEVTVRSWEPYEVKHKSVSLPHSVSYVDSVLSTGKKLSPRNVLSNTALMSALVDNCLHNRPSIQEMRSNFAAGSRSPRLASRAAILMKIALKARGIHPCWVHARTKLKSVVICLQFVMWKLRGQGLGFAMIARMCGDRDHATVIHACRKIEAMIAAGTLPPELLALMPATNIRAEG